MAVPPKIESHYQVQVQRDFGVTPFRKLINRITGVVNFPLLIALGALTAYGLMIVYSATLGSELFSFSRQLTGVVLGSIFLAIFWRVDYRRLADLVIPLLVIDFILILSPLIPFIGVSINGAHSWVNILGLQLQPAEPAKVLTIVVMAALVVKFRGKLNDGREYLKCIGLLIALLIAIMLQPDLGTGLVFLAIGMTVFITGGVRWQWLAITFVVMALGVFLLIYMDNWVDGLFGQDMLLKDYQKNRLLVFIDEDIDPDGAGYNLRQAKIAIGSGGLFGKGLFQSTQSSLGFLPEAPTDFIFCVLAEELGFVGCILLLGLYAALIAISFWVALRAEDPFGTLLVMGCVGMWVFQILENIGMTCGLMPITGIPLPFVSYGSSFMLTNFMVVGLILSVWAHRPKRKAR